MNSTGFATGGITDIEGAKAVAKRIFDYYD